MPSKRTFAKRLVALATTGLAVDRPISALTSVPPDTGGSAQSAAVKLDTASDHPQRGDQQTSLEPQSAVAAGKYDPTVAATEAVDTVAIGRLSPQVLKTTGLPPELATRIHPLLDRYDAISLDAIQQAGGGVAFTSSGPEGCAVITGSFDAAALAAELAADSTVRRESNTDGFARFHAQEVNAAVAVTTGEVVTAYGSTTAVAMAHRDAGIGTTVSHQKPATTYGDLPSRLDGDAVVYINLGTDVREHLHTALSDAPEALRTAVDASGVVGVSLRMIGDRPTSEADAPATTGSTGGENVSGHTSPAFALRYGAVADPRQLDRETVETLTKIAREGDDSLSDATVTRHGRTVLVDATASADLFASHASLIGATVRDAETVTDA
ncbi:hypothetical protein [Halorubrum lacusprofundi]|uniref:hypothetical protein n=1 Tax=Halorubrum lacusprofundi TaxID=2247 RepID=UPI000B5A484A|nr:hypothetical protein [Halorubrum lacusprofundi]MCG1008017.1 hypothetical protein [Halorubrum lacusprofundi]